MLLIMTVFATSFLILVSYYTDDRGCFDFPPNLRESSQCLTIKYDVSYRFFEVSFSKFVIKVLQASYNVCWGKFSLYFLKELV